MFCKKTGQFLNAGHFVYFRWLLDITKKIDVWFLSYALMCECWNNEPDRRPTFEAISRTIKRLERCHKVSNDKFLYESLMLSSIIRKLS